MAYRRNLQIDRSGGVESDKQQTEKKKNYQENKNEEVMGKVCTSLF